MRQPRRFGSGPPGSVDAAPAGGARNPALGRSRDPTGGHYDPSVRSLTGLGPLQGFVDGPRRDKAMSRTGAADRKQTGAGTRKRGPGDRNRRRWSAERRPFRRSQGEGGTPRKRAGRLRQPLKEPRKLLRFLGAPLPSQGSRGRRDDRPTRGRAKNTGDGAWLAAPTCPPNPRLDRGKAEAQAQAKAGCLTTESVKSGAQQTLLSFPAQAGDPVNWIARWSLPARRRGRAMTPHTVQARQ
jgi:hypothetical protein